MRLTTLGATLLLVGCPTDDSGDDPLLAIPEASGHYNLTGQIVDNGCNALGDWDLWEDVFPWTDQTPSGLLVFTADLTQSSTVIDALILPGASDSGCAWSGSIGAGGAFDLSGPCDDTIHREISLIGTVSEYGDGFEIDATLSANLDREGDGTADCTVEHVAVSGTGFAER